MSQNSRTSVAPAPPAVSDGNGQAFESSVRQLIANGKSRVALENAKQFHKSRNTSASESLLLDAYLARIQSLLNQNLASEAESLVNLVKERFPAAKSRLESVAMVASAANGALDGLLTPLNDPELSAERRAAIEQVIQTQVWDLTALARCSVLPPEHSLRRAATALDQAFQAVTGGPVSDEQLALPEVSHRSPLAPWKVLVRAIASVHRGENQACRDYLEAIKPESIPSRLIPAMQSIIGVKSATPLKPVENALLSRINVNMSELRSMLTNLDQMLAGGGEEGRVYKAVRAAVRECERSAPDRVRLLKQVISVRGEVTMLDEDRLAAALDGGALQDAFYFRMYALEMEKSADPEDRADACEIWDKFRQRAVSEGWFRANGVEVVTLYLHIADILNQLPDELLTDLQEPLDEVTTSAHRDKSYFFFQEQLYARACVIDPHPEAFSKWFRWAVGQPGNQAESVAGEWHRLCPKDIEPVLYLMEEAEKRSAFPTALAYLEKAERLDAVHPRVRAARLRLLALGAMRHLQQKKPRLALEKVAALAALPQSQQGERPAFLAALHFVICLVSGDQPGAEKSRLEVETLLGRQAAGILIFGVASMAKRLAYVSLPAVQALSQKDRSEIPISVARVMGIARDMGTTQFQLPIGYFDETEKQFPRVCDSLDLGQISLLAELGMNTEHPKLAWAASGVGLARGGATEARFMLLRARAMPPGFGGERYIALAAAALELGRFHRDSDVIDRAADIVRNPYGGDSISLTLEQARQVVQQELASPAFPARSGKGPNYSKLVRPAPCQCPDCRRKRGESLLPFEEEETDDSPDVFDEDAMERMFNENVPEGIPPELAKMMFGVLKESFLAGENPEETMKRMLNGGKKKKGKSRK